jgi:hypothetical protein
MKFFEDKDRGTDPLAGLGINIPDFETIMKSKPAAANPVRRPSPNSDRSATSTPTPPPVQSFQSPIPNSQ